MLQGVLILRKGTINIGQVSGAHTQFSKERWNAKMKSKVYE